MLDAYQLNVNVGVHTFYIINLLSLSFYFSLSQKLLGNSLLKLEGDDRLDINCTLPLTDQVFN